MDQAETTAPAVEDLRDPDVLKRRLADVLLHIVGRDPESAGGAEWFATAAITLRGAMSERMLRTMRHRPESHQRWVYYLSMEYLTGRSLIKTLLDLDMKESMEKALAEFDRDLGWVASHEPEPGLGNGGLGRLAACFLDSIATHQYPGFGYGLRYEFGMFRQSIEAGKQREYPENWLKGATPWEFERPDVTYTVRFQGRLERVTGPDGLPRCNWVDTDEVLAVAYDQGVTGYGSDIVTPLRLWSARSVNDFDLAPFNEGAFLDAVKDKSTSEMLTKVLYPSDKTVMGQELRFKQEYFFVSASLQDIIARFKATGAPIEAFPEKVAIQLNDTHPALSVPELLRLLVDEHGLDWDKAWDLARRTFNYTNHTLMSEALETWPIHFFERILPRHLEIIYRINHEFLTEVRARHPGDMGIQRRLSLVDDGSRRIRMAHLAVVASGRVNGVAELHTQLMRETIFADFARLWPDKFLNQTNGITPRRWLLQANPPLAALLTDKAGDGWQTELTRLRAILPLADDAGFREDIRRIKHGAKQHMADFVKARTGIELAPEMLFDVQIKRIHEYKRQLLNLLHVVARHQRLKQGADLPPRAVVIAGKAAPGYWMAKQIIRMINDVARVINDDPQTNERLKLAFIPNYNVTAAEWLIPGAELSEQISTAGTEASGTGNMKFALNGALTIGTMDGANIEIRDAVGQDNMFIFGLTAEQVGELRVMGYDPWRYYHDNPELKKAVDLIATGAFSPDEPDRYRPVVDSLLSGGDPYLLMADFADYMRAQDDVDALYRQPDEWNRRSVLNIGAMGPFSADRTIHGYARDVWKVQPMNTTAR